MRVLLLAPFFVKNFMRNARWDVVGISGSDWYPLYLGYTAGLLEKHGHTVKLVDAQVDNLSFGQTMKIVWDFNPQLTVIQYSNKCLQNDIDIGSHIRSTTGSEVLFVGTSASTTAEQVVNETQGQIMVAIGEYEHTVLEMAEHKNPHEIKGLVWHSKLFVNEPRLPMTPQELDELPFVSDIFKRNLHVKNYHQTSLKFPFIDIYAGRGCCWSLCEFCLYPFTLNKGTKYRGRSIPNMVEELRFIKSEMPYIKEVFFQDDCMPSGRLNELSEAILSAKLKMTWSGYSRANLDYETLKVMRKSGCRVLHVGYESSNPQILHTIKKGVTVEGMERFTKLAIDLGFYIVGDFITGLPGESVDTIKQTIAWAKKLPIQRYTITLPKPYKGTPLYDYLEENGCLVNGKPDYLNLSTEDIEYWNKWSLRQVYINPQYLMRMIRQPSDWAGIVRTAVYALPYLFNKQKKETSNLEW